MKNYYIGVNYWDSVSGTDMWVNFDESVVDADLEALSRCGVNTLRIFPNWCDFQPVTTMYAWRGNFMEYRLTGDRFPDNEFYLEPVMIERFLTVCDLAEKYGMKLIVGVVTGWMIGRLFVPPFRWRIPIVPYTPECTALNRKREQRGPFRIRAS